MQFHAWLHKPIKHNSEQITDSFLTTFKQANIMKFFCLMLIAVNQERLAQTLRDEISCGKKNLKCDATSTPAACLTRGDSEVVTGDVVELLAPLALI